MKNINRFTQIVFAVCLLAVPGLHSLMADTIRYEFAPSSRSIMRVGPNQSLDMLVQQIYPNHQEMWPQLKGKIREFNPNAFNRYTGKLIPGQRLNLVTIKRIHETVVDNLEQVGDVVAINGSVIVVDKNGKERQVGKESMIFEGDRLNTDKKATLVVKMIDGAEMRIKPDSSVRISQYEMKSGFEAGSTSIIDLIKGGLRKITGSIGANPLSVYRFHTGVMTIGVRGTDYVVKLCDVNDCSKSTSRNDANTRLHVVVLDGLITLEDEEGKNGELIMGQYAVATEEKVALVKDAKPVPGMLDAEEMASFEQLDPPEEKEGIWPWLWSAMLLGLGI